MELLKKVFTGEVKSIDEQERTLTAFVSTDARDRYDEVLDPKGADLAHYKKNPVVLWAHDYSMPPIGKALWIKKEGNGLVSKVKFAPTEFGQEVFQLYKEGFLKAFSVGFLPKSYQDGDGQKNPKRTYTDWELLEYSAVPVPANPEALTLAMQRGLISESTKKVFDIVKEKEEIVKESPSQDKEVKNDEVKEVIKKIDSGLEELLAENKLNKEEIANLKKEIDDLKYKLYQSYSLLTPTKKISEMTTEQMATTIVHSVGRVIREHQGKIN